ncbi:DUF559 domain-containing protein [Brevundimonas sp.]|uniref:endonuclease domain-containing protein n=1 Tax=Brevundimonas sp. TaxID=1871086 RepID=UPI00391928B5
MLKPTDRTRASARRSRREPTMTEAAMWRLLRGRGLDGFKFRRQMPIGSYVADFCCPALKLIIEVDGGVHRLREESDARRDAWLAAQGFTVLRFGNEAVLRNPNLILEAVRQHAARHPPSP